MFTGLNELTVVIPTVSRPLFVLRQFEYWGKTDANIVILDGAQTPINIPEELKKPNIRYMHTGSRFNERLATAGKYINTRYCALLTDDEFFLPSGLLAAIKRLEDDPTIIGCVGRCLYFFVDQGRFLVSDGYREWKPFPEGNPSLESRLDADLPPNKAHKAQFAILRRPVWVEMFTSSYSVFFSSGYTYERLLNLSRTVQGKTEILEELLWMRSMENPPISSENVPRRGTGEFVNWARSEQFVSEVARFREIALGILKQGGLSDEQARAFEERFFVGGVIRQATKQERNSRSLKRKLEKIVLKRSPKKLRLFAKRFFPNRILRFTGWQGYELDKMCQLLDAWGTHYVREELNVVAKLSLALDQKIQRMKVDDAVKNV
jgi:glycosyltransferase domain-containing protein